MREWLSGGVSPCQGEGRGFESRLALFLFIAEALILQGLPLFLFYLYGVERGRVTRRVPFPYLIHFQSVHSG